MAGIREIEWEACLFDRQPEPELERRFSVETGRPGRLMQFFSGSDWLSDTFVRLSVQLNTHVAFDADLADQAGLVVSQDNSCRFCFGAQRAFLRVLGMSEGRIERLEQDILVGDFDDRERAALDYARRVSRSQPLASQRDLDALRAAGLDELEIAELSGVVALHLFFNRISTFAALPPERFEEFPDVWWVRALAPILRARIRRIRKRSAPVYLEPADRSGAFSNTVNALDGLPLAGQLRTVIDGALDSERISSRTAALVFAVVSRALGCVGSEAEAARLLVEGGMGEGEVDAILTHLSARELSEAEALAVTFARETVWYQPSRIQRRCQDLRTMLPREQLLELLGLTSLANSVCRLGVLSGSCR